MATGYNSLHVRESGFRNPEVQCLEFEIHGVNSESENVFDSFTWAIQCHCTLTDLGN